MAVNIGPIKVSPGPNIGWYQATTVALTKTFTDTLTFTDALVCTGLGSILNESLTFTDTSSVVGPGAILALSETLTLSDSFLPALDLKYTLQETLNFQEGYATAFGFGINFADTLTVTAQHYVALDIPLPTTSESISFSDSFVTSGTGNLNKLLSEVLTFSDSFLRSITGNIAISFPTLGNFENFTLTDSVLNKLTNSSGFSEDFAFSDSFGSILGICLNFTEDLSFTDALGAADHGLQFSEDLTFTDSFTDVVGTINIFLQLSEDITFNDNPGVFVSEGVFLHIGEGIAFGDSINTLASESVNTYLRRYLNDISYGS